MSATSLNNRIFDSGIRPWRHLKIKDVNHTQEERLWFQNFIPVRKTPNTKMYLLKLEKLSMLDLDLRTEDWRFLLQCIQSLCLNSHLEHLLTAWLKTALHFHQASNTSLHFHKASKKQEKNNSWLFRQETIKLKNNFPPGYSQNKKTPYLFFIGHSNKNGSKVPFPF